MLEYGVSGQTHALQQACKIWSQSLIWRPHVSYACCVQHMVHLNFNKTQHISGKAATKQYLTVIFWPFKKPEMADYNLECAWQCITMFN